MEEADSKSIHVITGENVSGMSHNQIKKYFVTWPASETEILFFGRKGRICD